MSVGHALRPILCFLVLAMVVGDASISSARPKADLEGSVCGPVPTSLIQVSLNLDADVIALNGPFDPADPNNTSDFRATVTVFAAGGRGAPMTIFFARKPAANVWDWTATFGPSDTLVVPANSTDPFVAAGGGQLTFDSSGILQAVTGNPLRLDLVGGTPGQVVGMDFGPMAGVGSGEPTTQFAAESAINSISQDGLGLEACRFADFLRIVFQPLEHEVQLRRGGLAWVAVYGTPEVPVRALAKRSLRFGPARVRALGVERRDFWRRHVRDLDGDGLPDLLLRFPAQASGLVEPRDQACLDGRVAGRVFQICSPVAVCGPWCQRSLDPREVCGLRVTTRVDLPLRRGLLDPVSGPFDPSDPFASSVHRSWLTVFDSLGAGHPISVFVSRLPGSVWEWSVAVDPTDTVLPPVSPTDPFVLIGSGVFDDDVDPEAPSLVTFDFAGGAALGQQVEFRFGVGTPARVRLPWPGVSYVLGRTQDGQAPGQCRIELVESHGSRMMKRPRHGRSPKDLRRR